MEHYILNFVPINNYNKPCISFLRPVYVGFYNHKSLFKQESISAPYITAQNELTLTITPAILSYFTPLSCKPTILIDHAK